ncbi:hypothetical protein D3C75_1273420 [compost metagenome]
MGIIRIGNGAYAHMALEDLNLHAFSALGCRSRVPRRILLAGASGQGRYGQKRSQSGQLYRFAKPTFSHV